MKTNPEARFFQALETGKAAAMDLKTELEAQGAKDKVVKQAMKARVAAEVNAQANLTTEEINSYDHIIVTFSGGKDSEATFLDLKEAGVDQTKLELWHHDVDGREGSNMMDWNCTRSYCRQFAAAFEVPIYFSWKKGGFEGEMKRHNAHTQPSVFETPDGRTMEVGGFNGKMVDYAAEMFDPLNDISKDFIDLIKAQIPADTSKENYIEVLETILANQPNQPIVEGLMEALNSDANKAKISRHAKLAKAIKKLGTRLKFPQVAADLSVRWCSAYLKIMVCSAAINNQKRFDGKRVLLITGERAEESTNRASYLKFETHGSDGRKRTVHQYRPVHSWKEQQVWDIIERHMVNPHPAYRLGWGRVSCATCIFGSANQFASIAKIDPVKVQTMIDYEREFGVTIKRKETIEEVVSKGEAYDTMTEEDIKEVLNHEWSEPIILKEGEWKLPAGAFGESCGPV